MKFMNHAAGIGGTWVFDVNEGDPAMSRWELTPLRTELEAITKSHAGAIDKNLQRLVEYLQDGPKGKTKIKEELGFNTAKINALLIHSKGQIVVDEAKRLTLTGRTDQDL